MEAKTAVDTQGIGFAADSGSPVTKKLGDSLNIKGDNKNITTKTNNGDIHVALNDDISVQNVNAAASVITPKVVAGDSTLTSDGLNITGGPSITKTGISAGNKPITNVASGGTTDSNAANIGDVKQAAAAAKTVVKQGANTSVSSATDAATGATEYTVNAEKSVVQGSSDVSVNAVTNGLTTTYTADLSTTAKASLAKADTAVQKVVSSNSNLTASKTGDTVTLDFSQTPNFTSVTTGNSKLSSDGLKIGSGTNSVSLTNTGLSNGGNKITNIADGAADTDAASFKQVKAAKTEVQAGTNVASVIKTDGTNGQAIYTINAKAAAVTLENGADGLKLTSAEDTASNLTTYKLDLADKTKTSLAKADSALQNIGVQVNGTAAKTLNQANSTLNFVNGTGTTAENKNGNIAFNVNKANLSVNGGTVSADKNGDEFATAKSVADAINQAVTGSEKTSVVAAGDNTHVASAVSGNQTTYTVHADKTTVSAKTGGKLALNPTEVTNSNQTKTTNYELDLTDAAKAEIAKGVEAKTAVDTKGVAFVGNNGTTDAAKLGETVNLKGDDQNVVTEAGADGIKVKLKDEITVQTVNADKLKAGNSVLTTAGLTTPQVTAGDSVLNGNGLNIANGDNPVSLTKSGLNNGGNKITKVAKGENADDAVNYAQLKELADKGLTFDADGNTSTSSKKLGERVGIKGGNNITTSADNDNVTVKLNDDITLTSVTATTLKAGNSTLTNAGLVTPKVTAGNTVLEDNGLTIFNGAANAPVSLTKNGLNNGGNKITKVAEGALAADSTDAVNGAQLYKVDQKADTNAANIAKGINIGGTNNSNKYALGDTVNIKGDSNIVSDTVEGGVQLKLADTVKIGQDTGKPVSIDGTTGTVSGLSNTTLGGTGFATSNKAATEAQLDATQVNLKNILGGDAVNNNGNIAMSNIGGTNQNTVHDAIKSVKETAEKGWKLKVNEETSAQAEKISPDDEVAIKQGKNITVTRDGKNITVATSDDVAFNKVTVGDSVLNSNGLTIANGAANAPVSLTKNGLDNGGNKASNIAKGTADTDAVNVEQLKPIAAALNTTVNPTTGEVAAPAFTVTKADGTKNTAVGTVQEALDKVGEELKKGLVIAADEGSSEKVNLGDTVTYTSKDKNIVTTSGTGKAIDFSLAEKVTIGKDAANGGKPVVIDGKEGIVSGLTNTTLGAAPLTGSNKAATEAQLDATQVNLATILGGNAANNNGNVTTNNIGGTGKDNVHEAIAAVKETADKGWNLKANDETDSEKIAAGDTVTVKQGKNIRVKRSGKDLTVETEDDVEFAHVKADSVEATSVVAESVIAGNSVLNTDGLKIGADGSPNQVSLTTAGLNNGGNKITNVAKGTADTDAVNVSQLSPIAKALNTSINPTTGAIEAPVFTVTKADGTKHEAVGTVQDALDKVGEEVGKGLNIVADNGSSEKVNLGDTVKYTSKDKNIVTTSGAGKEIDFSLAEKVTIGKDAANGGKPVVIDGKEGTVSGLTNQALGSADFATKGQAATEEQLNETQANLAKLLGGNAANDKGNVATNDIGGTGKDNVHDAIAAVKETVGKGWNLKANDEADSDSENIASGDTVTVKQGKNIRVKRSGKELSIETSDDVEFGTVSATTVLADSFISGNSVLSGEGLKIGADGSPSQVSLTNAGLNNGGNKIANVAKGTAATDAVNVAQLNEQLAATEKTTTVVAGKNVTVSEKVDGNNTEYTVNADKTTLSQAANGAVKVSEGAKDADGVTDYALDLTDEAKADIAKGVAAKDAVDNKGLTFAADNGTTGAKKLGDSLSVKGDGNILTRADENGIGFSLADKITVGKAGKGNKPLVIDGTAGLISGLSNTTLGGADFATKGQAASEEQLNAAQANLANLLGGNAANDKGNVTTSDIGGTGKDNVHDAIAAVKETADKGWNLNANDETSSEKIGAGDTVTFKEGKNVKVSRNGKNITVATSDDVSFNKVTVGGSVLTDNGLTVGNGKAGKPVSLTKDGLDNGGNKVANVAKGEADTDAVNVAQLKAAAAKATSKVDSGNDNIVVTPEQNADGSTTYKVATAPNLKADSFTAGDTVVNNDGVKVGDKVALGKDGLKAGDVNITADGINAGNKAISNVAAGVKDTDAANVGQLNRLTAAAKTEVEAGTNIASVTSKQGANGQTVYTVNADGASVSAGSDNIVVTKGNKDADNVTDYAVDLSKAVKADIAKGVAAKDAVDNKGISFAGDSGKTVANKLGDTVAVKGDANITTTAGANGIQVGLNKDLKVDSVKAGDTVVNNNGVNVGDKVALGKDGLKAGDVNITADGINAGGKKVTGVAAGTVAADSTDAVNGGQLHQVYELIGSNGGNVNTAPPSVEADGKAGLGNIKNITLVDNSTNPNVTNVTNETKIAQSNGYSLVTYNVEDQGMYVTNNVIEAVGRMNEQGIKFFHTNDGEVNPDVQARNSEDSSASGAYATAVGYQAASKGTNAIAIGKGAKANAENTIAIGTGNIVSGKNSGAIGDPTVVSGNSSYSIGNNNNVSADNAYALGSNIKATVKDSVYLGDRAQTQGIHTADAAKGEAYTYGGLNDKAVAGKAGSAAAANKVAGVVTVGNGTDETRQVQGVAAGVVSADSTDAINGSQLYYTNQAIANIATQATAAKTEVTAGKNVVVNQTTGNSGQTVYNVATTDKLDVTSVTAGGVTVNAQGVSIAAPTAHNPANTVSLSPIGLNNGGQRITNVAPAKEGTDAVNLNQLAGMGNALQNNIERVGKKAYAGVAGAIAHSSIPQVTRPGATGLSVGSGYYGGQSAVAVGLSTMSDNGNWVFKGSFSANTDGHLGVGAGALYQW